MYRSKVLAHDQAEEKPVENAVETAGHEGQRRHEQAIHERDDEDQPLDEPERPNARQQQ